MAALDVHRGGSGEPLLLVHGLGGSRRMWEPVLPALEREHEVLALDLPGFGESPSPPAGTPWTTEALADAVEAELDRAGIHMPHVAGNSLGGWIALELARRGRARSVVAMSPYGMGTRRERAWSTGSLRVSRAAVRRIAPAAGALNATPVGRALVWGQMLARPWRLDRELGAYLTRAAAHSEGFAPMLDHIAPRTAPGLEEIRGVPVLIAWGTWDRLLLPRQAPRFVKRIDGAELRWLRGLGHVPMSDDPELVAETILSVTRARGAREGEPRARAGARAL